jgi:hypothetical protein
MLAKSLQAAAGNAAQDTNYIEDVFSTWLYTGNSSTQTINNGIDLAGEGGLVWVKSRTGSTQNHTLQDTLRGVTQYLSSALSIASSPDTDALTSFNSNGFSVGADTWVNASSNNYVSWTFRKQPKFFDVVTYTGTGANRTVAHNLGSVPGCIFVKRTDTTGDWQVYHRGLANTQYMVLNTTAAVATGATRWNSTTPTDTVFSLGTDATVNASGGTYIAYIFAHDAGGFGLTGTDNVISCGSFTTDGSGNAAVNLGYEPQWMITKALSQAENWYINDVMRGYSAPSQGAVSGLAANTSAAEGGTRAQFINATGFTVVGGLSASQTYVYIAIRRGPMKVPTTGVGFFLSIAYTGNGISKTIGQSQNMGLVDLAVTRWRSNDSGDPSGFPAAWVNRLVGRPYLASNSTAAETTNDNFNVFPFDLQDGVKVGTLSLTNVANNNYQLWSFRRAPSFMDVVCYTGTGANVSRPHNLTVAPDLWIVKRRESTGAWQVGSTAFANTEYLVLNTDAAKATGATRWNSTYPTASVFTTGTDATVNASGGTYVAYLFATCPGVSKVGSYTGNGSTQVIDCGFLSGARVVLIKRTDSTGDWMFIYGSFTAENILTLNGITAASNPNLLTTNSSGFALTSNSLVNASGGSFIFLAIA